MKMTITLINGKKISFDNREFTITPTDTKYMISNPKTDELYIIPLSSVAYIHRGRK